MGVTSVVQYPTKDQLPQQTMDLLQHRLEQIGAQRIGPYTVDCEVYQANPNTMPLQRTITVMHNTDFPASCFSVLDSGTCLVSDTMFNAVMNEFKDVYPARPNSKMETRGQRYVLGDFSVKVGSTVTGASSTFRGIIVEVEYLPCCVAGEGWELLKEFMQGILGPQADTISDHLKRRIDSEFAPPDVMLQYYELYNNMRRQHVAPQPQPQPQPQVPGIQFTMA